MGDATDNDKLYSDAVAHLIPYGGKILREVVTRTEGIYFHTATGKRVLDWTSGQMSCLIGHGHPEIVETITEHAVGLDHVYSSMVSPPVIELAKHLTAALPEGLDKALFLSTGSESNEAAIRMAKCVTGKFEIVGLGASWHGMTTASNGAQYFGGRKGAGPVVSARKKMNFPNTRKISSYMLKQSFRRCQEIISFRLLIATVPSSGILTGRTIGRLNLIMAGP